MPEVGFLREGEEQLLRRGAAFKCTPRPLPEGTRAASGVSTGTAGFWASPAVNVGAVRPGLATR
jgi:hypothetical protein